MLVEFHILFASVLWDCKLNFLNYDRVLQIRIFRFSLVYFHTKGLWFLIDLLAT